MAIQNPKNNENFQPQLAAPNTGDRFDAASDALSQALRTSFFILKIIMVVLVGVFLVRGLETVGPDEQAMVLRFGKIRGIGEQRLLGPGPHWVFPYPIDEIIKVPVAKKINLPIDSFWYFLDKKDQLPEGPIPRTRIPQILDPVKDGYCIIRSEEQSGTTFSSAGSDYNIVHCKWQLTYRIDDPERFFKNVYTEDVKTGQQFPDVVAKSVTPLLEHLFESAVVTAMVHYTIDEAISSQDRIPKHVKKLLQEKLDKIQSGIAVVSVQLTDITWPRQVDNAFLASIRASQESQKAVSQAKGYAENTLSEAAGPVAANLLTAFGDKTMPEQEKELLWSQLAGASQEKIAQARAYRTKVVETTRANAEYLQKILPEYRKHPQLVIQEIYQDTIEFVLNNADEKMIIQPAEAAKGRELRVLLNRDPAIKPKSEKGK